MIINYINDITYISLEATDMARDFRKVERLTLDYNGTVQDDEGELIEYEDYKRLLAELDREKEMVQGFVRMMSLEDSRMVESAQAMIYEGYECHEVFNFIIGAKNKEKEEVNKHLRGELDRERKEKEAVEKENKETYDLWNKYRDGKNAELRRCEKRMEEVEKKLETLKWELDVAHKFSKVDHSEKQLEIHRTNKAEKERDALRKIVEELEERCQKQFTADTYWDIQELKEKHLGKE